jgi:hypothetical protein
MLSARTCVTDVDLFAGHGGLGEGFSLLDHERIPFDVVLSVEKDPAAHQPLLPLLEFFFRQFSATRTEYYEYLKGDRPSGLQRRRCQSGHGTQQRQHPNPAAPPLEPSIPLRAGPGEICAWIYNQYSPRHPR